MLLIGAGQGNWCKILNDTVGFKSCTLVDLPEQLELAKKCLGEWKIKNVKFVTPEELSKDIIYTDNDSKVGNLARRLRKFFVWSERPLCKHKTRVKTKNVLHSQRSQNPTCDSLSVYDIVISDMSFSEFNRPYQELLLDRAIACSNSGFIVGHEFPKQFGVVSLNFDQLKERFDRIGNFAYIEMQKPSEDREDYFFCWKKQI